MLTLYVLYAVGAFAGFSAFIWHSPASGKRWEDMKLTAKACGVGLTWFVFLFIFVLSFAVDMIHGWRN